MSKKILLVSGHVPGYNKCAETGVNEGDLNIELVNLLCERLEKYADVEVYPAGRDFYKDNKAGTAVVNMMDYDYIFEVHFNAGKGTGTSIYMHPDYAGGVSVERKILDNLAALGIRLRGTGGFNYSSSLLNINLGLRNRVDYGYLETLFYDNPADMEIWDKKKTQIADAIANGIKTGFGLAEEADEIPTTPETDEGMRYRVQVGSFKSLKNAESMRDKLEEFGFDSIITKVKVY